MSRRRLLAATIVAAGVGGIFAAVLPARSGGFTVRPLVADPGFAAPTHDRSLGNAWGLAATPTGPWWVTNESRNTSTLYAGNGRKQALTIDVACGPTGVAAYSGSGFVVRSAGAAGAARFVYACEDGTIRAWSPAVPKGWSSTAVVAIDSPGSVFRGLAVAQDRLYVTDFHNDRIRVYDSRWRPVRLRGAFVDPSIPAWYAPFNVRALAGHLFVTYASPAPVNGNDAPTGGYVDEYSLDGRLIAHVARTANLAEPWGLALAPRGFGAFGGDLLVANFGTGRVNAYAPSGSGWSYRGQLPGRNGKPLALPGVWGIAFGNGHMAGPRTTLFFASGPHRWRGASELDVHGLVGAVVPG
ncbi:MAG TPA: TIGR03118 family protein [Gaiellaceae bacterium]|nr:TIGR03118 family protein [Gaiellaceae bacterium]